MDSTVKKMAVLLLCGFLLGPVAGHAASKKIKWYDYQESMALSRQENKKLFLHFYADWCGYCDKMNKETFTDSAVINYLNRNFVSTRVNSDKNVNAAAEYAVRGVPDTWFVTENGEKISHMPGFISADMLLKILKFIHTDSYKQMTFKEFLKIL